MELSRNTVRPLFPPPSFTHDIDPCPPLDAAKPKGLQSYLNLISQRALIQGFVVFDYSAQYPTAVADIGAAVADGSIKRKFHVVEGLEKAPEALLMLYSGGNTGKL